MGPLGLMKFFLILFNSYDKMKNDSTFFFKPEEISHKISDVQGMFRCSEAQDARSAGARTV